MADPPSSYADGVPGTVKLNADELVPRGSLAIEDAKDRAARRWGGLVILIVALLLSGGAILISPDQSKTADKAWSLLFVIVGYAGAYLFRNSGKSD